MYLHPSTLPFTPKHRTPPNAVCDMSSERTHPHIYEPLLMSALRGDTREQIQTPATQMPAQTEVGNQRSVQALPHPEPPPSSASSEANFSEGVSVVSCEARGERLGHRALRHRSLQRVTEERLRMTEDAEYSLAVEVLPRVRDLEGGLCAVVADCGQQNETLLYLAREVRDVTQLLAARVLTLETNQRALLDSHDAQTHLIERGRHAEEQYSALQTRVCALETTLEELKRPSLTPLAGQRWDGATPEMRTSDRLPIESGARRTYADVFATPPPPLEQAHVHTPQGRYTSMASKCGRVAFFGRTPPSH